jgi:hypothetical protein
MAKMMPMYKSKESKKMAPAANKKAEMKKGMPMMMGMRGMKMTKKK